MRLRQLSQRDYKAILSAVEDIYRFRPYGEFPTHILSTIKNIIPCDLISYNEVNPERTRIISVSDPAQATAQPEVQKILQQHLKEHPLVEYYARTSDGRSIRLSDFITQRQFHDLGLYDEFYKPLNIEYQMTTSIVIGRRNIMGIALSRKLNDFSENERLALDLLRPHLVQAYRSIRTINVAYRNCWESEKEFITLNRSGQIQALSSRVWQMLEMYFGCFNPSRALPKDLNDWLIRERNNLNQESGVPRPPFPFEVYKGNSRLTIYLIWGGEAALQDVLLFDEEPIEHIAAIPDTLRLTVKETEILALISKGKTNREISEALSISSRTVKKHLEHIYRKLGVHTRGAAVARFLRL